MNQRGEKNFETNTEEGNESKRREKFGNEHKGGGEEQTGKNEKHDAPSYPFRAKARHF
jgi:hypothetical protein